MLSIKVNYFRLNSRCRSLLLLEDCMLYEFYNLDKTYTLSLNRRLLIL